MISAHGVRTALGLLVVAGSAVTDVPAEAATGPCGTATSTHVRHVIVVVMENRSYGNVIGNTSGAPYENTLARQCGLATKAYGATHTSAANYLAISAGRYPSGSTRGCGSVSACVDSSASLYSQLAGAGLRWKAYMESATSKCQKYSAGAYKIGHNPPVFYSTLAGCPTYDVPVADLTRSAGAFYTDLVNNTLPAFAFVSPNTTHDGDSSGLATGDTFLSRFVPIVTASASYRAGNTALIVTYDEGSGGTVGQDCTNKTADLAGNQESCHIPVFVVSPGTAAGARDATFFDHYSLTRFVEDVFGRSHLAHAADAQTNTLLGHFGLTR
jgi:phospholipase C